MQVASPAGSTHFKINAAAAAIDFEKGEFDLDARETDYLLLDGNTVEPILMPHQLPAASELPLFAVLGIAFAQEVNGKFYPLKNGGFNSLCLVKVSGQ